MNEQRLAAEFLKRKLPIKIDRRPGFEDWYVLTTKNGERRTYIGTNDTQVFAGIELDLLNDGM